MQTRLELPEGSPFSWVLLLDPTKAEAEAFGQEHGLHPAAIRDFILMPSLPKFERIEGQTIVLFRAFDDLAKRGDTFQAMTRRLLVIQREGLMVTVARREQPFLREVIDWARAPERGALRPEQLLIRLGAAALKTFEAPLKECEDRLDAIEAGVIQRKSHPVGLRLVYGYKRRCNVTKRILWRSLAVLDLMRSAFPDEQGLLADLREETDRLHAWADELVDSATQLNTLLMALASQRTNDVMRVLTVFSAFFLPLTFIVGVYGMNFARMPELSHPFGYPGVLIGMLLVVGGIYLWFRRKGWLR